MAQSLTAYNTFGIEASCDQLFRFQSEQDIQDWLAGLTIAADKFFVLGGGSNLLLLDHVPLTFLQADIQKISYQESGDEVTVTAGAGVNWHQLVLDSLDKGYAGLENLSLIPGNVGAAPIQNIGAYGVELEQRFISLSAVDLYSGERRVFTHEECQFGYRDSIFKGELRGRYIITEVTLRLYKKTQLVLTYGPLMNLSETTESLTAKDVSDEVIKIRQSKLPDPSKLGNAGSFFKNPVVSIEQYQELKTSFPDIVAYPVNNSHMKLAAGWLIDQCGLKGYRQGDAGVHQQQALVMVNHGNASGHDILKLAGHVRDTVLAEFGVRLEPEVWIIGQQDVF
ncbi:UDP-N-acetylmuramate dehydrogenase [Kangiella spongicola]|uniref:UDP-N-acetylenolpyruvoylglucosamine reductase n=1 Tax=Kangiella spongicola TaxID=796379 RepID=A0A318DBN1_9GAMM|nr:UDP-N-acetylmuramate dehydrogenase [Kangiella spongicola]PXF63529.1 UDP-N-acetylenolpyruvoylglucosamine reductase [Kangiella spongicola]